MSRARSFRRRHGSIDPSQREDFDQPESSPGEDAPPRPAGWTKHELITAAELSGKSFDSIRKAARVPGPTHGGLRHVFSAHDLIALIQKAESGKFTERGAPAARAWRPLLAAAGIAMPEVISRAKR